MVTSGIFRILFFSSSETSLSSKIFYITLVCKTASDTLFLGVYFVSWRSLFSSVSQSSRLQHARLLCPLPVPELIQTHVHWVGDAEVCKFYSLEKDQGSQVVKGSDSGPTLFGSQSCSSPYQVAVWYGAGVTLGRLLTFSWPQFLFV